MKIIRNHVLSVILVMVFSLVSFTMMPGVQAFPPLEEAIIGVVVKTDKELLIEAEDGDYFVKGMDLSGAVGKMIEAVGVISETEKGDFIEVKSFEELQE